VADAFGFPEKINAALLFLLLGGFYDAR